MIYRGDEASFRQRSLRRTDNVGHHFPCRGDPNRYLKGGGDGLLEYMNGKFNARQYVVKSGGSVANASHTAVGSADELYKWFKSLKLSIDHVKHPEQIRQYLVY